MQGRPAGFIHIGPFFDHFFNKIKLALDRGQHQRAFTLGALGIQIGLGPVNQHLGHFWRRLPHSRCQAALALWVQHVRIKTTYQKLLRSLRIVTLDSLKKIAVRASESGSQADQSHKANCFFKAFKAVHPKSFHAVTPLKSCSKLRLVASAMACRLSPLSSAISFAT